MSEVEETKTPDSTVKEEKQETAVTEDASEKDAASEISAKDKDVDNKGTVLDVFKKFAASTGPSWADMMVEEASQAVSRLSFCQCCLINTTLLNITLLEKSLNLLTFRRMKNSRVDSMKSPKQLLTSNRRSLSMFRI